jgi:ribosomal protein L19
MGKGVDRKGPSSVGVEIVCTSKHVWTSDESDTVRRFRGGIVQRKGRGVSDEMQLRRGSIGRTGRLRVLVEMIWGVRRNNERIGGDYFIFDRTMLQVNRRS